jgi:hypothetical protein
MNANGNALILLTEQKKLGGKKYTTNGQPQDDKMKPIADFILVSSKITATENQNGQKHVEMKNEKGFSASRRKHDKL